MDSFNSQRQKLGLNIFIFLKILLDVQKSRSGRQNRAKTFFEANQKLDFCRGELDESFSDARPSQGSRATWSPEKNVKL